MKSVSIKLTYLLVALVGIFSPKSALSLDVLSNLENHLSASSIGLFLTITTLSLAPAAVIMITCFPLIVTVLSILKQAIGLQQSPPSMVLVSISLFLTFFIMEPTARQAWESGLAPYLDGQVELNQTFRLASEPFKEFMANRVDRNLVIQLSSLREGIEVPPDLSILDMSILVPSFMLSELSYAFEIGFLIFLPFLIIDLVIAAILMSMGMMMVPPAIVALPFKLGFFVIADGWALVAKALVGNYS